jgi:hypothetical protein
MCNSNCIVTQRHLEKGPRDAQASHLESPACAVGRAFVLQRFEGFVALVLMLMRERDDRLPEQVS